MLTVSLLAAAVLILPITWVSVRLLRVSERYELVAGIFLTVVYALVASTVAALLIG